MTGDIKKVATEPDKPDKGKKKKGGSMNDAVRSTEEIRKWNYQTMGIPNLAASLGTNIETGLNQQ
jgi:hypothetical protein